MRIIICHNLFRSRGGGQVEFVNKKMKSLDTGTQRESENADNNELECVNNCVSWYACFCLFSPLAIRPTDVRWDTVPGGPVCLLGPLGLPCRLYLHLQGTTVCFHCGYGQKKYAKSYASLFSIPSCPMLHYVCFIRARPSTHTKIRILSDLRAFFSLPIARSAKAKRFKH